MSLVRIIKDWTYPDLFRQTPHGSGIWDNVHFTMDDTEDCDFVIVLNFVPKATKVRVPAKHIWQFSQEPPVPQMAWSSRELAEYSLIFTPDHSKVGKKYVQTHTALPWHVGFSYDALRFLERPEKTKALSWITSSLSSTEGHKRRLSFLERLRPALDFDLFGRGFNPIEDKALGLLPYHYSLAIENYSGLHYWTEKLADCFLSWTMPIYYGCTNIEDYFPAEAMIRIDIQKPEEAIEIIKDAMHSSLYYQRIEAIAYARDLILEKYQFFPFVVAKLHEYGDMNAVKPPSSILLDPSSSVKRKPFSSVYRRLRRLLKH